jgi:hypothetical protein
MVEMEMRGAEGAFFLPSLFLPRVGSSAPISCYRSMDETIRYSFVDNLPPSWVP